MTYRGRDAYKTRLGALVTIAMYVLMTINAVSLLIAFNDGSKQEENVNITTYDQSTADSVNLGE